MTDCMETGGGLSSLERRDLTHALQTLLELRRRQGAPTAMATEEQQPVPAQEDRQEPEEGPCLPGGGGRVGSNVDEQLALALAAVDV